VETLNEFTERREKAQKRMEQSLARGDMQEVQMVNGFIQNLTGKIEVQNKVLARANEQVEMTRKKLMVASQERQIIEKHRDKKKKIWKMEMERLEAIWIDELATGRFHALRRENELVLEEEERYEERRMEAERILALKAQAEEKRRIMRVGGLKAQGKTSDSDI
jgi:flagellar export protein FliJ